MIDRNVTLEPYLHLHSLDVGGAPRLRARHACAPMGRNASLRGSAQNMQEGPWSIRLRIGARCDVATLDVHLRTTGRWFFYWAGFSWDS